MTAYGKQLKEINRSSDDKILRLKISGPEMSQENLFVSALDIIRPPTDIMTDRS